MENKLFLERAYDVKLAYKKLDNIGVNKQLMHLESIVDLLMEQEAPRFYITPKMAERYILGFKRQDPAILSSRRIDMIKDLVEVYDKVCARYKRVYRTQLWDYVVNSRAKSFYISRRKFKEIINNPRLGIRKPDNSYL